LLLFGGMGDFGRLEPAQFIGVGKFIQTFQAEELEKNRRGLIEQRPSRLLGAARDLDDFALQQRGENAIDRDAAHRLDLRAADRLAIGNNRESLQARLAEARGLRLIEETIGPHGKFWPGLELISATDILYHEARSCGLQLHIQLLDRSIHVSGSTLFVGGGFVRGSKPRRFIHGTRDGFGSQGSIGDKQQRFDDTGQVHPTIFKNLRQKGKRGAEKILRADSPRPSYRPHHKPGTGPYPINRGDKSSAFVAARGRTKSNTLTPYCDLPL